MTAHMPGGANEHGDLVSLESTFKFWTKSCNRMETRDRAVGSGSAQQAMLSAGSDLVNPSIQAYGLIFL